VTVSTEADAEIRTVLARIAQLADTGDLDEYVTLFADDAVWAMPDNPSIGMAASEKRGIAEIRAGAEERRAGGVQGPGTNTRHVLTTTAVFVESETRATARSYFMFYGSTTTQPELRNMGQYDDVLVRGERGWQLAHRTITFG
jgi:3-phenylpropionate/cinnamic acid dioxygenase small subunit